VATVTHTDWSVGNRTDRQFAAEDECGNRATFMQMLYPDGACTTSTPSPLPSTGTTVTATTTTNVNAVVFQPDNPSPSEAPTAQAVIESTVTTTAGAIQRDDVTAEAAESGETSRAGKGSKVGTSIGSTSHPESTLQPDQSLASLGKAAKGKNGGARTKNSKRKHGTMLTSVQLNVSQDASLAAGVLLAVVVVAAVVRKRPWKSHSNDAQSIRAPLMQISDSVTAADGFAYSSTYDSCDA
jgi:hypothetical protein